MGPDCTTPQPGWSRGDRHLPAPNNGGQEPAHPSWIGEPKTTQRGSLTPLGLSLSLVLQQNIPAGGVRGLDPPCCRQSPVLDSRTGDFSLSLPLSERHFLFSVSLSFSLRRQSDRVGQTNLSLFLSLLFFPFSLFPFPV